MTENLITSSWNDGHSNMLAAYVISCLVGWAHILWTQYGSFNCCIKQGGSKKRRRLPAARGRAVLFVCTDEKEEHARAS